MACVRCGGTGYLAQYAHVQGGVCFRCGGSGRDPKSRSSAKQEIYKEVRIGRTKVVLATEKDSEGRFVSYRVWVEGRPVPAALCSTYGEAQHSLDGLVKQVKRAEMEEKIDRKLLT
ncbi:MAG: hypothetical protein GX952_00065 [Firmicutes bacterium]|nr:hypothetical protein [Bacillota bacterium]